MNPFSYPIDSLLPPLQQALRKHPIVLLTAQPGAGKTTQVPLALLQESWLHPSKILMLEPRRLAARAAARRMSDLLGEPTGTTVGYRTRLDTNIGPHTRLEVVTEGILTRILQHDPSLSHYGMIIFDEFHERSLQTDLGLALSLQTQALFRADLRLLIMSATLDTRTLPPLLNQAPVLNSEGRTFPVETRYVGFPQKKHFAQEVARIIYRTLLAEAGNLLVFLPGTKEIRHVEDCLLALSLPPQTLTSPLYGNLSPQAQDQAILPPKPGWRKIVLATNVAETSLTIEGIRIVVDTGLVRVSRYDPRSGMSRLITTSLSQASADQRRGRAGRLEPGLCLRCWPEAAQRSLLPRKSPEILDADLTSLALELAVWGAKDAAELFWIDPPPAGAFRQAQNLLHYLGALDSDGRITGHGRKMAELPVHPRLAHMMIQGMHKGLGTLACDLAAVLNERELLNYSNLQEQADLRIWLEECYQHSARDTGSGIHHRIRLISHKWQTMLGLDRNSRNQGFLLDRIGLLLALAYPDRIAQRQAEGNRRYKLSNGHLACFSQPHYLEHEDFLVIADLDGGQPLSKIHFAAPLHQDDLHKHLAGLIQRKDIIEWNEATRSVIANQIQFLGELVLETSRLPAPDPEIVTATLLEGIRRTGLSCLPWTRAQRQWQARVLFLRQVMGPRHWPDVSDPTLKQTLENWLAPYLIAVSSLEHLNEVNITWPLQALLTHEQQRTLDTLAPAHLTMPTGSRIPLDYQSGTTPILAVRLQELFGMTETPRIANNQVPVLIHLLSPARRPVQVTQDLQSFWRTGYAEVKKELKGRYPKHFWPDDPLQAPLSGKIN